MKVTTQPNSDFSAIYFDYLCSQNTICNRCRFCNRGRGIVQLLRLKLLFAVLLLDAKERNPDVMLGIESRER